MYIIKKGNSKLTNLDLRFSNLLSRPLEFMFIKKYDCKINTLLNQLKH